MYGLSGTKRLTGHESPERQQVRQYGSWLKVKPLFSVRLLALAHSKLDMHTRAVHVPYF